MNEFPPSRVQDGESLPVSCTERNPSGGGTFFLGNGVGNSCAIEIENFFRSSGSTRSTISLVFRNARGTSEARGEFRSCRRGQARRDVGRERTNPRESGDLPVQRCTEIGPDAADRMIVGGLCDLEGNSRTAAGACKGAQTMQRRCSTGVKKVASRVFNVERMAASTIPCNTLWPLFGAQQSILLHLYPLLKVFVCPS